MIFRPHLVARLANTGLGLAFIWLGILALKPSSGDSPDLIAAGRILAVMFFVPGLYLTPRGYRIRVALTSDSVSIRGFLWSRTVPRPSIVGIGTRSLPGYSLGRIIGVSLPVLQWRRRSSGRLRSSPMWALASSDTELKSCAVKQRRTSLRSRVHCDYKCADVPEEPTGAPCPRGARSSGSPTARRAGHRANHRAGRTRRPGRPRGTVSTDRGDESEPS